MRGVEFLDHLDAGAAVLSNLIDVRSLHEPYADVGVAQAVGRATIAVAIKLELGPSENPVKELDVVSGEYVIRRLGKLLLRWLRLRPAFAASLLAVPSALGGRRLRTV